MIDKDRIPETITSTLLLPFLEKNLLGRIDKINFPPPIFEAMKGEVVDFDIENESLKNKFPVLSEYLNPYGSMQGGMISAAIDNTIGPLSLLVSPPSFTRHMEVKYRKIVSPELGYIYVTAKFIGKKKQQLFFEAVVEDSDGNKLASAKSTHWVID
ncbi:PaaI family thioesterase [Candidatus Parabeggiatoa sp. HSG14]|uniref:PaaI family thioesterase n=1 Tax=Candidatus Parabeggiatoa sp. HSG14 TaxID=3055593 RepID=UPI0025A76891|nr:PaaI family thioesterase [Thiotrichales bacterium HSG14]